MFQNKYEKNIGMNRYASLNSSIPSQSNDIHNIQCHSNTNLSCLVSPEASIEELKLIKQMGVTHVFSWIEPEHANITYLLPYVTRIRESGYLITIGLVVYNIGVRKYAKNPDVILGTNNRDKGIQDFCRLIKLLAEVQVYTTTFTWEADGVWSTHTTFCRGDAECRTVSQPHLNQQSITHDREYSEQELWSNLKHFLDIVVPIAEECKVRLSLHPNDPPIDKIAGVPCLFRNNNAFKEVFELYPSKYFGMEFCCGTWLEGGNEMGESVYSSIKYFLSIETFLDAGYGNMYLLMKILIENKYSGTIILDHSPLFIPSAGPSSATTFAIGFLKGLIKGAEYELE